MLDETPELATRLCSACKEEKSLLLHFAPKGKICRDCNRKSSAHYRKERGCSSKNKWGRFKFFLAVLFMLNQGECTDD